MTYVIPVPAQQQREKLLERLHQLARELGDVPPVLNPTFSIGEGGRGWNAAVHVGKATYEAHLGLSGPKAEEPAPPPAVTVTEEPPAAEEPEALAAEEPETEAIAEPEPEPVKPGRRLRKGSK